MDLAEIYNFLFNTYAGMGCLIGIGVFGSIVAGFITERKTRKVYQDLGERPEEDDDDDDEDDDDSAE